MISEAVSAVQHLNTKKSSKLSNKAGPSSPFTHLLQKSAQNKQNIKTLQPSALLNEKSQTSNAQLPIKNANTKKLVQSKTAQNEQKTQAHLEDGQQVELQSPQDFLMPRHNLDGLCQPQENIQKVEISQLKQATQTLKNLKKKLLDVHKQITFLEKSVNKSSSIEVPLIDSKDNLNTGFLKNFSSKDRFELKRQIKSLLTADFKEQISEYLDKPESVIEFPKSFKGLVQMAKSYGLDVKEMSLDKFSLSDTARPIIATIENRTIKNSQMKAKHLKILQSNACHLEQQIQAQAALVQDLKQAPKVPTLESLIAAKEESIENIAPDAQNLPEVDVAKILNDSNGKLNLTPQEKVQLSIHFVQDLKGAVKNYKPPITRLKIVLQPQNIGEVDVVLTKSGDNINVQVSAQNGNGMAMLQSSQQEIKTALQQIGFKEASMSFSDRGQSQQNPQQQQYQNPQQQYFGEQNAYETGMPFAQEELVLNINLPLYA